MPESDRPTDPNLRPGDEAPPDEPSSGQHICPRCKGEGAVEGERCEQCGGTGQINEAVGGG